jgi:hypothetical protein
VKKLLTRVHIFLSHHSILYATVAGIGIVLFWRGVWHSADVVHYLIEHALSDGSSTLQYVWWDGPLSFVVGVLILWFTRAYVSSFIGNELILSGLRTEEKITKETEGEVKTELHAITDIKEDLEAISENLEELEEKLQKRK